MKFKLLGILLLLVLTPSSHARTTYDSLPVVKKGGNYNESLSMTPITLVPMLVDDLISRQVAGELFMSLFSIDGETYEEFPALAEKVEISKDQKTYTYTLNSKAKWSDGTPVTSDDFEFTFNKLMDKNVKAAALRGFYEGVSFKKIDALHFSFHVNEPKFNTRSFLNGFDPIQKKQFENEADFNKSREGMRPIGNSAYKLKSLSRDQAVVLERDPNWWARDLPAYRARFNYDTITFKIISDPALLYEKFLKGEVDGMTFNQDQFMTQVRGTDKERFGKSPQDGKPLWADRLPTDGSLGWFGIALNLKNPILSSKNTRKGLAHLVDYKTVIEKVYFGIMEQCISPFGSNTKNVDPSLRDPKNQYHFDLKQAAAYFKQDGWVKTEGEPFLSKVIDGKKTPFQLSIKFASANTAMSKATQIMKETFKKAGVDLVIRAMDSAALFKDFDDKSFEMMSIGWGGGSIYPDPKQIWSSESMNGGSNNVSYSNPKVDELIKKANVEFNRGKREKLLQQIGKIIYDDLPYIFFVEKHFLLQGLNSKIKSPKWLEKYGNSVSRDLFHE